MLKAFTLLSYRERSEINIQSYFGWRLFLQSAEKKKVSSKALCSWHRTKRQAPLQGGVAADPPSVAASKTRLGDLP